MVPSLFSGETSFQLILFGCLDRIPSLLLSVAAIAVIPYLAMGDANAVKSWYAFKKECPVSPRIFQLELPFIHRAGGLIPRAAGSGGSRDPFRFRGARTGHESDRDRCA